MPQFSQPETQIPMSPTFREFEDINPDPTRYQLRPQPTFNSETCEVLGLNESWWEPLEEVEAYKDARAPLSLPRDLLGYEPLRLWFGMPHLTQCEKNDDWFEMLFTTLFELTEDLCISMFGVGRFDDSSDDQAKKGSPWADPGLSPSFLFYASEIARQDNRDGGWDALLADPCQRAMMVQGVLAKALDEHVLSALLFGGTAQQQDALGQWDRIMLQEEGYKRKYRRCEEVQLYLGDKHIVTPHFWAEVERVTAQTAQLLLPLVNLQRARAAQDLPAGPGQQAPSLAVFYQRLHDVVALSGYASLCMAWSTSIFQVEFPQPGMTWNIDQECEADEYVYASSEAKARAATAGAHAAAADAKETDRDKSDWHFTFMHAARIKIVSWPCITRFKPEWNRRRTAVRRATSTILSKSHNAYYYGGRAVDVKPGSGEADEVRDAHEAHEDSDAASECDSHGDAKAVDEDDERPYLHDYIDILHAQRRRAHRLWWARCLGIAWIVVVSLAAWAFGLSFWPELAQVAGLKDVSVSHVRNVCYGILASWRVDAPLKLRESLQAVRGVVGVSSV
ncbi:hypothetical protein SCUCBS95973_008414 [Sporothrix curviconia]|uniref:Uncharacterized protein n=1 Tax=Sporothrix curviconia TaxID=1260050 RepID=A0ABP0CNZ4_9PEZI